MRLGILGGGRAAWAYGSAWIRVGWPLAGVWLRPESRSQLPELLDTPRSTIEELAASSELILVAVSDRAVPEVLAQIPDTEALLFHASGALPSPPDGFSLHPLKSLPPVGERSDLENTLLVFEGKHRKTARLLAAAIGARFAEVTAAQKPLYHAAAVFGSNYVAAMLDIAESLINRAGVEDARGDLAALARSAITNWSDYSDSRRFTGPAIRGDRETIGGHLQAIGDDAQVTAIYKLLAEWIAASNVATPK